MVFEMNKNISQLLFNIVSAVSITALCIGCAPNFSPQITSLSKTLLSLSCPQGIYDDAKTKFSDYISSGTANNTTATSGDVRQTMNAIVSKDSFDDSDITATPPDIKRLMQAAKRGSTAKKGATSEQAYQGGGTILSYGKVSIQNKIPPSFYKPDIKALLKDGTDLSIPDKSKPTILIYHSHTTEAYSLLDVGYYISSDSRSNHLSKNMVRVGDDLTSYLEKAGFNVIHDRTIHDTDYNASYDSSRRSIEKYLEKYPSIEITIDVHRDDITFDDGTKVKPTATVLGKKAARMMIIAGCQYNRVKNFPGWEDNLRFDLQVQKKVSSEYPDLMRPIMLSERKYNMFETPYSFLLEIGTDANTLDEACYSARLFGKALGEMLNEDYVK